MPRNNQIVARRAAQGGIAGALYQGARVAYENREIINDVVQEVKRRTKRQRTQQPDRARSTGMQYTGGNDFSKRKSAFRRTRKARTNRAKINHNAVLIKSLMQPATYRAQNITNYDTSLGALPLRNSDDSVTVSSPVHVWDLTTVPNQGTSDAAGYAFGWAGAGSEVPVTRVALPTQGRTGVIDNQGRYYNENGVPATPLNVENGHHAWTSVNINFYGPRKRTTWFEVIFFTPKDQFADPIRASLTNSELKYWLQYMERPLIYSNLQTDVGGKGYNKMKIIRRFKYYVSSSQTTDVDSSVGKIKQAKIFVRHDKLIDFDWQHDVNGGNVIPHGIGAGVEFVNDSTDANYPHSKQRVYMCVRAFAPERTDTNAPLNADVDPSYDIIIRNHWNFCKQQGR